MRFIILKDDVEVNTIIASEEFAKRYCDENGYTYREEIIETPAAVETKPTEEELTAKYDALTVSKIREQYSADDEYKVLREVLAYPDDEDKQAAFAAYNEYVESCKAAAHAEVYEDEQKINME